MTLTALYQDIVLEHNRAPRNFGALHGCTHAADGANPLCGDELRFEAVLRDGRIADLRFSGESCAVTTAAASMLSERARGCGAAEFAALHARFAALLASGTGTGEDAELGELNAFAELRRHPARSRCALLPFATLAAALQGLNRASTEVDPTLPAGGITEFHPDTGAQAPMRTPLTFRAAEPGDVPAIVALVESAYRGDASRVGWTTEADLLDGQRTDPAGVAKVIANPGARIVLCERGGELLACAHIERQEESCYFGMFSVRPSQQGGGVGNVVLAECERIARLEFGCRAMRMTVISVREELIAWYQRRGYVRTGETRPFPYGDERFGIPKRPDLEFIVLAKPLSLGDSRWS